MPIEQQLYFEELAFQIREQRNKVKMHLEAAKSAVEDSETAALAYRTDLS